MIPQHVCDRRLHPRLHVSSRVFVDLGLGNRATVLNLSEGGLRADATFVDHPHTTPIRLGLTISGNSIGINGQVAWVSASTKQIGIRFTDLHDNTRRKIREWISSESSHDGFLNQIPDHGAARQPSSLAPTYHLREARLDDLSASLEAWRECNRLFHDHTIHCDPDWLGEQFRDQKGNVRVYFVESAGRVVGAVPFVLSRQVLLCKLARLVIAKFPLRVLSLPGYTPNLPAETSVYDMLFDRILKSECDAIQLDHVKTSSFLWNYVHSSSLIQKFFRSDTTSRPLPHPMIHLNGSFAGYMNRFSKSRKDRFREMKNRLRARGNMQLIHVTQPSEVDGFLDVAYGLALKTWQFVQHGWGLGARDLDVVRSEMHFLATRGWLRSYLLKCDSLPCAFIVGQQYGSVFYPAAAGVAPAWRPYGAGTVLFLLVLEDLFRENPPQFYDLDGHGNFQEHFASESYLEAPVWLFRRRPFYPLLAGNVFCACNALTRKAGALLDRVSLKSRLRDLIWR